MTFNDAMTTYTEMMTEAYLGSAIKSEAMLANMARAASDAEEAGDFVMADRLDACYAHIAACLYRT